MGIFSTDEKQITLIYNSKTLLGRKTLAYVNSSRKKIRNINTSKTDITETQWAELTDHLNIKIRDLINTNHPDFKKYYNNAVNLDDHDWLKLIKHRPELVKFSILIDGDRYHLIDKPTDFFKYIKNDNALASSNYNS